MKLSEFLHELIADFETLVKSGAVNINMGDFINSHGDKCSVCLGGAYLYKTVLALDPTQSAPQIETGAEELSQIDWLKASVLDHLRSGDLAEAQETWEKKVDEDYLYSSFEDEPLTLIHNRYIRENGFDMTIAELRRRAEIIRAHEL